MNLRSERQSFIANTEGAEVGYRWFAKMGRTPLFPFGYGLSYTEFAYSDLKVAGGLTVSAEFSVTNTGAREGADVPQLYLVTDGAKWQRIEFGFAHPDNLLFDIKVNQRTRRRGSMADGTRVRRADDDVNAFLGTTTLDHRDRNVVLAPRKAEQKRELFDSMPGLRYEIVEPPWKSFTAVQGATSLQKFNPRVAAAVRCASFA